MQNINSQYIFRIEMPYTLLCKHNVPNDEYQCRQDNRRGQVFPALKKVYFLVKTKQQWEH
jgi:hypothetical protein